MTEYVCPMHPKARQAKPGFCSICGMALEATSQTSTVRGIQTSQKETTSLRLYAPLFIIVGLITLVSLAALAIPSHDISTGYSQFINNFMAGFFLVFAGFKLIDVPGFAHGYRTYDLLAKRAAWYGYLYPFIELGLGLAYLTAYQPTATNIVTLVVMSFSGLGVALKIRSKSPFQCACLGTAIKLPLTKVTLIEDFGMATMALLMLLRS